MPQLHHPRADGATQDFQRPSQDDVPDTYREKRSERCVECGCFLSQFNPDETCRPCGGGRERELSLAELMVAA
jgi:hypothetical protein